MTNLDMRTPGSTPSHPDGVGAKASGVAQTANSEAGRVVDETRYQARQVAGRVGDELRQQADHQVNRASEGLTSVGRDLDQLAATAPSGLAGDLVRQAARRTQDTARWLEGHDARGILDEVRRFARRRPAAFLGIAVAVGVVAGRLTRSLGESASDAADTTPAVPATRAEARAADLGVSVPPAGTPVVPGSTTAPVPGAGTAGNSTPGVVPGPTPGVTHG